MNRFTFTPIVLASSFVLAAAGANAQATERFDIDPSHSGVIFSWNHFGFSNPTARFDKIQGSVLLDKADLTKSSISISLPIEGLDTGVEKLDEALKSGDFLEAGKYPTITFVSTRVERLGKNGLKVIGDLSLHGVTKSVTLDATVNKIGIFEIPGVIKAETAGFDATAIIKRSDFGVTKYLPAVSDELTVRITLDAKQAQAK
jgi:polyisoprenoid-binding protein YceI